jgi:hypothetical protein
VAAWHENKRRWREDVTRRYCRCPVHHELVIQRWIRGVWQWSWGCQSCLEEVSAALNSLDKSVEDGDK